jgi:uncharacterized protein YigE (DUF2233 family)
VAAVLGVAACSSRGDGGAAGGGVAMETVAFAGASFDVVTVDLSAARVRVVARDASGAPLERFARVRDVVGERVVAVMNAGIFEPGLVPTGWLVSDGVEVVGLNTRAGEGNFYLAPNGAFAIDEAGAWIEPTSVLAAARRTPAQATQSGPLLVSDGALHAALRADSTSKTVRNGVGVVSSERVVLVISREPVSLHAFATFFRDRLGCRDALYLDGAISGMWAPGLGRADADRGPFAAFVVVEMPR